MDYWIQCYDSAYAKMKQFGYKSIHGTMAINFDKNMKEALNH